MNNVMVDLETMSTDSNAAIVSIGAVAFDKLSIGDSFLRTVNLKSCTDLGMHISADTVVWWMKQESAAKFAAIENGTSIQQALVDFSEWLAQFNNVKIWGNGSDFDNVILSNAYRACKIDVPWKFCNNRCYRTIKSMYPDVVLQRQGTHHNAVDDAISQATHLSGILNENPNLVL